LDAVAASRLRPMTRPMCPKPWVIGGPHGRDKAKGKAEALGVATAADRATPCDLADEASLVAQKPWATSSLRGQVRAKDRVVAMVADRAAAWGPRAKASSMARRP